MVRCSEHRAVRWAIESCTTGSSGDEQSAADYEDMGSDFEQSEDADGSDNGEDALGAAAAPDSSTSTAAGKRKVSAYFAHRPPRCEPASSTSDDEAVGDDLPPLMLSGLVDFYERQAQRRRQR